MARYDLSRYWSTHNSFEGRQRGSLESQLTRRVRCVELDFWDNDFGEFGDFRLGHIKPGDAVELGNGSAGQNPKTSQLKEWLKKIADWSDANPIHAPITLILDAKSDLTDSPGKGDLEDLNSRLEKAFGSRLFTRYEYDQLGGWPEVSVLRGRVICVLSGNSNTRATYRYCFGAQPAIAVNDSGNVVLAHRSSAGDMRYWSGKVRPRLQRIDWLRKGTYAFSSDTVSEPSLAITDDGFVVSVHRLGPRPNMGVPAFLECRVGELQSDDSISWGAPQSLGTGLQPSLAFIGANKLEEIHKTTGGSKLRITTGTLNRAKKNVTWNDKVPFQGAQFPRDTATWKTQQLSCGVNAQGLVLGAVDGRQTAVQYRQLAFVEMQDEEGTKHLVDPRFYGTAAGNHTWIEKHRGMDLVARGWWFKKGHRRPPPSPPQENLAGTDDAFDPLDPWYDAYMAVGGQTEE